MALHAGLSVQVDGGECGDGRFISTCFEPKEAASLSDLRGGVVTMGDKNQANLKGFDAAIAKV